MEETGILKLNLNGKKIRVNYFDKGTGESEELSGECVGYEETTVDLIIYIVIFSGDTEPSTIKQIRLSRQSWFEKIKIIK